MNIEQSEIYPALPLNEWDQTRKTLHLFIQIVGKIRLYTHPKMNHWWHVPLYVSTRGVTTGSIPYFSRKFELAFDFIEHQLVVSTSNGSRMVIPLRGRSVAKFYNEVNNALNGFGVNVDWKLVKPYDVPFSNTSFAQDKKHNTYQAEYVNRYWRILRAVDCVFQEFRGRFLGKSTPPHLFWHHMDLALTRFNGKAAPVRMDANVVDREAYSHETISFGFWAGDEKVPAPAFYAYTAPAPDGLFNEPISPAGATWNEKAGMALLMYDNIRNNDNPNARILEFLESTYQAGAKTGGWDEKALRLNP